MPHVALIGVSDIRDGSMSAAVDGDQRRINRSNFLKNLGLTASQTILVKLSYDTTDFQRYLTVTSKEAGDGITKPSTVTADALFTAEKNVAMLLPVADCIAAVLYDPVVGVLGLSHLGRHNLLQRGAAESIQYMARQFGTNLADVSVWLSPSVGSASYPLYSFGGRSLREVAIEQFVIKGVLMHSIEYDNRDTATDAHLFSHSEYLKGNRPTDGRQAVVAMMRP